MSIPEVEEFTLCPRCLTAGKLVPIYYASVDWNDYSCNQGHYGSLQELVKESKDSKDQGEDSSQKEP